MKTNNQLYKIYYTYSTVYTVLTVNQLNGPVKSSVIENYKNHKLLKESTKLIDNHLSFFKG